MVTGAICISDPRCLFLCFVSPLVCYVVAPHNICYLRNMIMVIIPEGILYCLLSSCVVCVRYMCPRGLRLMVRGPEYG